MRIGSLKTSITTAVNNDLAYLAQSLKRKRYLDMIYLIMTIYFDAGFVLGDIHDAFYNMFVIFFFTINFFLLYGYLNFKQHGFANDSRLFGMLLHMSGLALLLWVVRMIIFLM